MRLLVPSISVFIAAGAYICGVEHLSDLNDTARTSFAKTALEDNQVHVGTPLHCKMRV